MQETVINNLVIGTRGSKLALAQAEEVRGLLIVAHDHLNESNIEIKVMSTRGDRVQDRNLSEIGGKGLFTEEIEDALHNGEIDIAVHSLKDMPTRLPKGLELVCQRRLSFCQGVFFIRSSSRRCPWNVVFKKKSSGTSVTPRFESC